MIEYPVHAEFKLIYWGVEDFLEESNAFLSHISSFIQTAQNKLSDSQLYSMDCTEFYFANGYGNTFRDSFIVSACSFSEIYLKKYIEKCVEINKNEIPKARKETVMEYLKTLDKNYLKIGIDFNNASVIDFTGLQALRNAIVHSGNTFQDVLNYKPQIIQLSRKFKSIEIFRDEYIFLNDEFCKSSLNIVRDFFYYLVKLAIRRYYNFVSEKEYWKIEEGNCR
jgi:hypothetical protein